MTHATLLFSLLFGCGDKDGTTPSDGGASDGGAGDGGASDGGGGDGGGGGATDGGGGDGGGGDGGGGTESWPMLVVNEFMASNGRTIADESGAWPDWVELYNPSSRVVELEGWTISDDAAVPDKHVLDASLRIPAGGFLLLWADDDDKDGPLHLDFKLSATGEQLVLSAPDGTLIDFVEFGKQLTDVSAARKPDGGSTWVLTDAPTPGWTNGG